MEKKFKILMINGSPHKQGNTKTALLEMKNIFEQNDFEVQLIEIGTDNIRGCIACGSCYKNGKCVFDDKVNEIAKLFEEADGLVVGSPVYYASANSTLISLLTRLFYSTRFSKTMKVGCAIAAARRGGLTSTFDELNKFFAISGMPIASGQYWNGIHGGGPNDALQDLEGLQMMRTLARNMAFLIKSINLGKEKYGLPEREKSIFTNFIR